MLEKNLNQYQFFLLSLMLLSVNLFGLILFSPFRIYVEFICVTVFLYFLFSQYENMRDFTVGRLLCLYFIFFSFSCIYSIFINGQSPISMYHGVIDYVGIFTFTICFFYGFTYKQTKNVLLTFSLIFCLLYIFQWVEYPSIYFRGASYEGWSEERFRMRMPGSLSCFYIFLNGIFNITQSKYFKALIYLLLGGIPIIVMGFRSLTVITLVASLILFVKKSGYNSRSIVSVVVLVVLSALIANTSLFSEKLEEMSDRQETQTFSNDDYVRWIELDYYINFFNKTGEWILGGGVPCGSSEYTQKIGQSLEVGMYWQDLGIVGLSFIIGIITVLILVILSLRMISRSFNSKFIVECLVVFIALFGSIMTSMEFFRPGNFMILGLLFYCEYIGNQELGAPVEKLWLKPSDYPNIEEE